MTVLNVEVSLDVAGQKTYIACKKCFPHDDSDLADIELKISTNDDAEIVIVLSQEQCKEVIKLLQETTE